MRRFAELSATFLPPGLPEGWQINLAMAWAEVEDEQTGEPLNSIARLNGNPTASGLRTSSGQG